jgi:hypothetical protein
LCVVRVFQYPALLFLIVHPFTYTKQSNTIHNSGIKALLDLTGPKHFFLNLKNDIQQPTFKLPYYIHWQKLPHLVSEDAILS